MKIILDANVLISYLLSPTPAGKIAQVVDICLSPAIDLIVPGELVAELEVAVHRSEYLEERIPQWKFAALLETLRMGAVYLRDVDVTRITRDPKDDYLLQYAAHYAIDFLITGDKDLLALGQVQNVRIVSPAQFLDLSA